jgi:hypothetical protein
LHKGPPDLGGFLFSEENKSMAGKDGKRSWVMINRAPVLTLWAAVVAEILGSEHDEALTPGRAKAGLNAHSKGVSLGFSQLAPKEVKKQRQNMRKEEIVKVDLLHRGVPAKHTIERLRALSGETPHSSRECAEVSGEQVWRRPQRRFQCHDGAREIFAVCSAGGKGLYTLQKIQA